MRTRASNRALSCAPTLPYLLREDGLSSVAFRRLTWGAVSLSPKDEMWPTFGAKSSLGRCGSVGAQLHVRNPGPGAAQAVLGVRLGRSQIYSRAGELKLLGVRGSNICSSQVNEPVRTGRLGLPYQSFEQDVKLCANASISAEGGWS